MSQYFGKNSTSIQQSCLTPDGSSIPYSRTIGKLLHKTSGLQNDRLTIVVGYPLVQPALISDAIKLAALLRSEVH